MAEVRSLLLLGIQKRLFSLLALFEAFLHAIAVGKGFSFLIDVHEGDARTADLFLGPCVNVVFSRLDGKGDRGVTQSGDFPVDFDQLADTDPAFELDLR